MSKTERQDSCCMSGINSTRRCSCHHFPIESFHLLARQTPAEASNTSSLLYFTYLKLSSRKNHFVIYRKSKSYALLLELTQCCRPVMLQLKKNKQTKTKNKKKKTANKQKFSIIWMMNNQVLSSREYKILPFIHFLNSKNIHGTVIIHNTCLWPFILGSKNHLYVFLHLKGVY